MWVGYWLGRKAIFLPIFLRTKRKGDLTALDNLNSLSYIYSTYIDLFTNDDISSPLTLNCSLKKAQELTQRN